MNRLDELQQAGAVTSEEIAKILALDTGAAATQDTTKVVRDCAIAVYGMMLQATHMGLGSCWVSIRDKKGLRALCSIPASLDLVCLLAVGKPKKLPEQPRPRVGIDSFTFLECYGSNWRMF